MINRVPLGRAPTFQRGSALETQLLLVVGDGEHGRGLLLGLRLVQFDAYTTPVALGNEEYRGGRVRVVCIPTVVGTIILVAYVEVG